VTVPSYPTLLAHQIEYILRNSASKVVFASSAEQLEKLDRASPQLPALTHIVTFDPDAAAGTTQVTGGQQVLSLGALEELGAQAASHEAGRFRSTAEGAAPDDVATIIYTSGTTGIPKGVVLTHGAILANIASIIQALHFDANDTCLSFLPLSHVFERTCGHFVMMHQGVSIAYAESVETVQQNLAEVRPTILISVPRLYEKIYSRVKTMVASSPPLRQKIFRWALGVGWQAAQRRMVGRGVPPLLGLRAAIADRLVFKKLKARTGGRIRFFVSGGAPLSAEVARFFFSADFTILEGYGLTETAPVLCANREELVKLGTVGPAIPDVELTIADDGEILTRGPNLMRGYYRNDEATSEAIDADGWFHTGDVGVLDEDGYLTITDRKKDLLVTSGGKNIAPQPVENCLKTSRYIAESVLIGDRRKFPVALIVPDFENLMEHAVQQGIRVESHAELCRRPEIVALMQQEVDTLSTSLSQYERPKKIALIEEEFTIESGELTPSLKVKRKVVLEKYKAVIDGLYQE
jgi:long-chain acyl-CoA synthetase